MRTKFISVSKNRVYICRLGCTPCRLCNGDSCEQLKVNAFENAIKDIMNMKMDEENKNACNERNA